MSVWSSLTPILFCINDASFCLSLSIAADSGPCHSPYVVSDSRCVSPLFLFPPFFAPSMATAIWK
eukprot:5279116-Pleurochrysis_carterae.AAC.1